MRIAGVKVRVLLAFIEVRSVKFLFLSFNDLFIEKASVKINFVGEILNHITNSYRNNIVKYLVKI